MDDLRIVAARLWDLVGRKPVPTKDLVEALYANLRWFPPSQAEHLVGMLQSAKLLVPGPSDGTWVGASELERTEVPLTYRPPSGLASSPLPSEAPADLLARVVQAIAASTREEPEKLRTEAVKVAQDLGVVPEVGGLLVGWRRGVALPSLREEVDRRLRGDAPSR